LLIRMGDEHAKRVTKTLSDHQNEAF